MTKPQSERPGNFTRRKNIIVASATGFLLLFILFFWTYKLNTLPGLHADEAWSGIKAVYFSHHPLDQLNGMNHYTGIIQAAAAKIAFGYWGINVFSLRIGGVIFNLLGLLLICGTLIYYQYKYAALAFLFIISQSALYLTSPRVAWEVNTFMLFFISLLFVAIVSICQNSKYIRFWSFIILFTNVLGAYNHILFSAVTLSVFGGLCLWAIYHNSLLYKRLTILFGISIVNIMIVILLLRKLPVQHYNLMFFAPLFILGFLLIENILLEKLYHIQFKSPFNPKFFRPYINGLLVCFILVFIFFHGRAFFEVLTGYKIFLQNYSYECPLIIRMAFITTAIIFIGYFLKYIWQDFKAIESSVFVFVIVVYLGVVNIYTRDTSFRYYLDLYAIITLYTAWKMSFHFKKSVSLIGSLAVSLVIVTAIQVAIFSDPSRKIKAIDFTIGNGFAETSAHFLPKEPLINFLQANRVGSIYYFNGNPHFSDLPIEFYKFSKPWKEKAMNKATVGYDYKTYNNGYAYHLTR
jgi:hypothetical protein